MTTRLSKGCTLVLLLSMSLALAAGLLAWGPLSLSDANHLFADGRMLFGIPNGLTALACLPMCAVCVCGMQNVLHADWPSALCRPWLGFFTLAFMMAASAALYHLAPDNLGWAIGSTFAAGAFALLLLAFLAERVDARFGSPVAVSTAVVLALGAGAWWLAGEMLIGRGDLRPLLLLQALPALLIPAGALSLPGRHSSGGDWLFVFGLYGAARLLEQADAAVFAATGLLGGHALMHLLLAAGTAWLAYRASGAPRGTAVSPSAASQRQTSLNTSG